MRLSRYFCPVPILILGSIAAFSGSADAAEQQWQRISSDHFVVLTDAGQKKGHEAAARFEQMRAVFGQLLGKRKLRDSEPVDIIAIGDDKEYAKFAPRENGQSSKTPAFALVSDDRIYFVLNLSEPDSWRGVEHQYAHYLLNYNYPPTQAWFDEGMAEYFASLSFTAKQVELGTDPELSPAFQADLLGNQRPSNEMKSLTEILSAPVWLAVPDLFGMKNRVINGQEGTHHTLFYAQSWMTMHYLINRDKLSETGKYFQLVMIQKVPVEQAIQQAYGMSVTQLDQAVKDYFHSLTPLFVSLDKSKEPTWAGPDAVYQSPLPFGTDEVGSSATQVPAAAAQALVSEMELRIPERRVQAVQDLEKLGSYDKTETAGLHRALAWAYLQKNDLRSTYDELNKAIRINSSDPFVRYYLALATYHSGEKTARVQGLANMMESLQVAIDQHPDFAEAYNMLGWARLVGGGANSAVEAMRIAVQLAPRNEEYQHRLARAYLAAKKFDEATATLQKLTLSTNPEIVLVAKKDLNDLPFLKRYGVSPQEQASASAVHAKAPDTKAAEDDENSGQTEEAKKASVPENPEIDRRPVKFLKGTLISVDCSRKPAAVVTFTDARRTLKLRISDRSSALVIGAPELSCNWKDMAVNVNYRARGGAEGDLVSIEVH